MERSSDKVTRWARWSATLIGFPIAGLAARAVAGPIDSVGAAVAGGLAAGAVMGLVQVSLGGIAARTRARWTAATAVGFAAGLAVGARTAGFDTDPASLAVMGAFTGAGVGAAQAFAGSLAARDRVRWVLAMPALWALAWLVTSQVIVDADRQHAVFGLSGATIASVLSGVLYAGWRPAPVVVPARAAVAS